MYLWWRRKKFGHKQVSCTIVITSVDVLKKCPFSMFANKNVNYYYFFFHICVYFYPVLAMLTLYTCLFLSRVCNAHTLYLFVSSLISIERNFPSPNLSPSLSYITNDKYCLYTASKQKCPVIYYHKSINNYLAIEILTVRLQIKHTR